MDGYIAKPIRVQELYQTLAEMGAGQATAEAPPPPPEPPDEVIDLQAALAFTGGDARLLRELMTVFLDDCPRMLGEVREAAAAGDAARLRRAAHALKGSAGYFSASAAVVAAQTLERMGRENDLAGVEEACGELKGEVARLRTAVAAFLEKDAVSQPFLGGEGSSRTSSCI
jgi:HPt (histidine-containing phosphotransfer) domain-containing protein